PPRSTLSPYTTLFRSRVRARTLHEYRGMVRRYIKEPPEGAPPLGAIQLHRLTPQAFEGLYQFLWKEQGLAPRTLQYLHTVLRQRSEEHTSELQSRENL